MSLEIHFPVSSKSNYSFGRKKSRSISKGVRKMFDCSECEKRYANSKNLRRHYRSEHLGIRFSCKLCDKYFDCNSKLKIHTLTVHSCENRKMYDCPKCDKQYAHRKSVNQHYRSAHMGIRVFCELCGKNFVDNTRLKDHTSTAHGIQKMFDCPKCEKKYAAKNSLNRHYQNVHSEVQFYCESCGRNFNRKDSLRYHIDSTHMKVNYKCHVCEEIFNGKDKFKFHMERTHLRIQYECDLCAKVFGRKDGLKFHMESLHLKIQHECDICGEVFIKRRKLKYHIESAHFKIQYECDLCAKIFSRKDTLKAHMDSSHVKMQYVCDLSESVSYNDAVISDHCKSFGQFDVEQCFEMESRSHAVPNSDEYMPENCENESHAYSNSNNLDKENPSKTLILRDSSFIRMSELDSAFCNVDNINIADPSSIVEASYDVDHSKEMRTLTNSSQAGV